MIGPPSAALFLFLFNAMHTSRQASWLIIIALGTLSLSLGAAVYQPGLSGGFLFDDFANLDALGATGPVDDWATFWRYVTSGTADPTGRPVALLSFLIDGNDWPTAAYPFKRTNLVLHLVNALLLGSLLWRIGHLVSPVDVSRQRIASAAILASTFWLLHPLMVSTTLYIVQRQAMLPATFLLLALHGWLQGRVWLSQSSLVRGAACMTASVSVCTLLATLSKGNGVLIPALVGVVELVVLRRSDARESCIHGLKPLCITLLLTPSLLVVVYLASRIPGAIESTPNFRPWTLGQRLLSEPRILIDYLSLLWVPRPFTAGLYNDNVIVSTSIATPWTTLPAMLMVLAAPICAWRFRKRYPLASSATLFFWIGHSIESSVIPLELYYEHRNYLPALLMFWPLAWWLVMPGSHPKARLTLSIAITLVLASMTYARASLWGDDEEQALVWAALNPDSPRAQTTAALHEMHMGRPDLAYTRLTSLEETMSNEVQIALNRLGASCRMGGLRPGDLTAAMTAVHTTNRGSNLSFKWMDSMLKVVATESCPGMTLENLEALVDLAEANPRLNANSGRKQEFLNIRARIELVRKNADAALTQFNAALDSRPAHSTALEQAATLGRAGYPRHALKHLEHFENRQTLAKPIHRGMPQIHQWVLEKQGYWTVELHHLKQALREDFVTPPEAH